MIKLYNIVMCRIFGHNYIKYDQPELHGYLLICKKCNDTVSVFEP